MCYLTVIMLISGGEFKYICVTQVTDSSFVCAVQLLPVNSYENPLHCYLAGPMACWSCTDFSVVLNVIFCTQNELIGNWLILWFSSEIKKCTLSKQNILWGSVPVSCTAFSIHILPREVHAMYIS
jgi:hypothetical protein